MIVIVIYIVFILIYGIFKKVSPFDSFTKGVEANFKILLTIFPNILALVFAINVFINSGIIEIFEGALNESFLPVEIFLQCLFKPLSSSSSMLMMFNIYDKYGVDSNYSLLSSILQGSSDTTIYIIVIYFSSIRMKKTKEALTIGLLTDLLTFVLTIIVFFLIF